MSLRSAISLSLTNAKRFLIILGERARAHPALDALLVRSKLWLYAEPLSNFQLEGGNRFLDLALISKRFRDEHSPDVILHFGGRLISKRVMQAVEHWVKNGAAYYLVNEDPLRLDPQGCLTEHLRMDPFSFLKEIKWISSPPLDVDPTIEKILSDFLRQKRGQGQWALLYQLSQIKGDNVFFLGNSTPVRDFTSLGSCTRQVFANRGVSGIEGHIATTLGLGESAGKACLGVIGDLSFLHDLNSLAMGRFITHPHVIVVINNQGGAIFYQLKHLQKQPQLKDFFVAPHSFSLSALARRFDVEAQEGKNVNEVIELIEKHFKKKENRLCVIEYKTNGEKDMSDFNNLLETIRKTLDG